MLAGVQGRMMLDARRDHMVARRNQPGNRQVVAFGPAAGEDDLRGAALQELRHRFPRILHRGPRLLPMMMNGRGIAKPLGEVRSHGLKHFGQYRSCGVIVEINAAHKEAISILSDARLDAARVLA